VSAGQLTVALVFGALMFVAGRKSVRRQFNKITNASRHSLVVHLDDDKTIRIEDAD